MTREFGEEGVAYENWGEPKIAAVEQELYALVERYLNLEFYLRLKPRFGSLLLVTEDISQTPAPEGGAWSRPDLAAVAVWRHKFAPQTQLDLYSFEVKRASAVDARAVHEALAHRRFVNYSYLVWNRSATPDTGQFALITDMCSQLGVGLIVAHDPWDPRKYSVPVVAERFPLEPDAIDAFIEMRMSQPKRTRVLEGLASMAWRGA